ncbi:MAG: CoA-binding protein [Dehalococcoidia bacterium]|jgi:acyl-CoA synthetase (NDP forming)
MPKTSLDYLFNPSSIAIAGVSPDASTPNLAQLFVTTLRDFGFKGQIYPIHPSGGEIFGTKVYTNVREIPGPVDYVISAIPARFTPQLIADCAAKGVKAVHLFTSGYGEIEDEIGKKLEGEILELASKSGLRLVGPNCMGIYCPASGLTFAGDFPDQAGFPRKSGSLGLISQSGGNCIYTVREAADRGVFFSKAISYGNAADLNEVDYLEYMADDPQTKLIAMYIEGTRDGKRLMRALKNVAGIKPVIIYKGGNTETGARACASHTGSIAGSAAIWHDFIKQVGAIPAGSMPELVDMGVAFLKMKVPQGRNTVVIGTGGGVAVQASDDITGAGLNLPVLPEAVRKKLVTIYGSEAGSIFRNPVDAPPMASVPKYVEAVRAIAESDQVDVLILHCPFDIWAMVSRSLPLRPFIDTVAELTKVIDKPMAAVLHYNIGFDSQQMVEEVQKKFVELGLPVYPSIQRAATAINRYIEYNERLTGVNRSSGTIAGMRKAC